MLAKSKTGKTVYYLVKWKGFSDDANTWQKRQDIYPELVDNFEADFVYHRGNRIGIELVDKRSRRGKTEYLVKWKGRPVSENSWEMASNISPECIRDFELGN